MWDEAVELGEQHGYRNAQATVLAPTGTIGFMMDCDTTGVEPDIALVKYKKLVGGGLMKIVNQTVPMALQKLGYSAQQVKEVIEYIDENETIEGAPHMKEQHLPVFDCAFKPARGVRSIHYMGHVRMVGAVQPFISGAISKTVNVPKDATVEEIQQAYIDSWRLGHQGCVDLPRRQQADAAAQHVAGQREGRRRGSVTPVPRRRKLPDERHALTHKFDIQGHEGYITVGLFEDGTAGRDLPGDGQGRLDDLGLRRRLRPGDQLRAPVRRAAAGPGRQVQPRALRAVRDDQEPGRPLRQVDRRLHLPVDGHQVPVAGRAVPRRRQRARGLRVDAGAAGARRQGAAGAGAAAIAARSSSFAAIQNQEDAPPCSTCGSIMVRSGSCYKCANCGTTSGCA